MKSQKQATILGVLINSTPDHSLLKTIELKLEKKEPFFITTPNPEIILMAHNDRTLRENINSSDFAIPDGVGLKFAAQFLGQPQINIIKGRVFMEKLLELANEKSLKVVFLGGSSAVIEGSLNKLKKTFPLIKAKGFVGPRLSNEGEVLSKKDTDIEISIVNEINAFKPDLLFIGFGAPKQEKWFSKHKDQLKVVGTMVVGGSLDVFSGYKKVPPHFFDNNGLEWLWRLLHEPSRIGRIINAVFVFPLVVLVDKIRH